MVLAEDVMAGGARALPTLAGALAARGVLLLRERLGALDARAAAAAGLALLSRQVSIADCATATSPTLLACNV